MFVRSNFLKLFTRTAYRSSRIIRDRRERPQNYPDSDIKAVVETLRIQSPQDWKQVREDILSNSGPQGQINLNNIDAMTLGVCTSLRKYNLAFSYLDFLEQQNIKLNLATLGKYFKLLYTLYTSSDSAGLSDNDENRILSLYTNLRKTHPVLDPFTLDSVIQAVSLTKQWKQCLQLLEEMKIIGDAKSSSYSAVIAAAFRNNQDDLAWKLLQEMIDLGKTPFHTVYLAYLTKSDVLSSTEIEQLLLFWKDNHIVTTKEVADKFLEVANKMKMKGQETTIDKRGYCKGCKKPLQNFDLTDDEFESMKRQILKNVIIGKDVFCRTTPHELDNFRNFVTNMKHHDVVVDGLNVAYSKGVKQPPSVTSGLVAAVVSHFVEQNKSVLVLGRTHMQNWPQKNWNYVTQSATVFLTQNLSQDDPYLLYCALNSGRNTIIISRDLMRGHRFLLRDFRLRSLFDRWLSQRQYPLHYVNGNKPQFKYPLPYSEIVQKNGTYWHVPYRDSKNENIESWLCLNISNK